MPRQAFEALRYTAFSDLPDGGNPAGVVLGSSGLSDAEMLTIAAEIGYSETAFVDACPADADQLGTDTRNFAVRYFSPQIEVPFCGHATIAAAIALAERIGVGHLLFETQAGPVPVAVHTDGGRLYATLTSVPASVEAVDTDHVTEVLSALDWQASELDPGLPPRVAFAGARHLVLAAGSRARLASLDYDFERLAAVMRVLDVVTVHLVWRADDVTFHVRNAFPVGGIVEDPATGAAAAAFGAYARELSLVAPDAQLTLLQGEEIGRPSTLAVTLLEGDPRVRVTGAGRRISTW
ncbi:PhzF family phenazine biosynthesis isomerase [Streptomyces sp. NPDC004787]|uniref:PhzF family phenazine biosynthesis protein n=1 Tax=Streptomyces sp. NPDC004787 TaxID=3154291 RepID=UPI0033A30312